MIVSVAHNTVSGSSVAITLDDGTIWHDDTSLPPDTALRRELAEWLAAGGIIDAYTATPVHVPETVSAFQARVALSRSNMLSSIQAFINNLASDDERRLAWEYATEFSRSSPSIASIASELSISEKQLDDLFILAATIKA